MNAPWKLMSTVVAAAAIAACSTPQTHNSNIDNAHRLYEQAAASSDVNRYAQAELVRARDALARADEAWKERRDNNHLDNLGYIAAQRSQLAIYLAAQRAADARIETAGAERERLRADARTRQAQIAEQNARSAQSQALSAQAQAQFAQTQAQNAQAMAAAEAERANRLQKELSDLQAKPTDHGLVVMLQDVLFDTGKATLRSGAESKIDQLAVVLKNHPERRVLIEGFTDSVGSEESNLVLSRSRAESVRNALISRGVAPDRIDSRGNGESRPVASNSTQAGRQQNRRVEIVFSDERGRIASIN